MGIVQQKKTMKWVTQAQWNGLLFSVKVQGYADSYSVITKTKMLQRNS